MSLFEFVEYIEFMLGNTYDGANWTETAVWDILADILNGGQQVNGRSDHGCARSERRY